MHEQWALSSQRAQQFGRRRIHRVREHFFCRAARQQIVKLLRATTEPLHAGVDVDRDRPAGKSVGLRTRGNTGTQSQLAVVGRLAVRRPHHQSGSAHRTSLVEREVRKVIDDRLKCFRHAHGPQPVCVGLDDGNQRHARSSADLLRRRSDSIQINCDGNSH
jgi:hypothetical protein